MSGGVRARAAVALAYGAERGDCREIARSLLGAESTGDAALHGRLQTLAARAG